MNRHKKKFHSLFFFRIGRFRLRIWWEEEKPVKETKPDAVPIEMDFEEKP